MGVVCLAKGHRRPTLAAYPDNFGNNQGKLHASYADTLRLVFVSSYTMHTQMHMHTRTCNAHAHAYVTPVFAKAAAARACSHTYCYHPPRRVLRRGPQQMACSCSCSSPRVNPPATIVVAVAARRRTEELEPKSRYA